MKPSEAKWKLSETKRNKVEPSGTKWNEVRPSETTWNQVKPSEIEWIEVRVCPGETKWDLPPPTSYPASAGLNQFKHVTFSSWGQMAKQKYILLRKTGILEGLNFLGFCNTITWINIHKRHTRVGTYAFVRSLNILVMAYPILGGYFFNTQIYVFNVPTTPAKYN